MSSSIYHIREFVEKLLTGLPGKLYYHSTRHTLDVFKECTVIGELENIGGNDLLLLQVAALFHDTGFLKTYDGHELQSCRIAEAYLPGFGFSKNESEVITSIIMCTQMPQHPDSHLGEIICDADLDYLGRDDFSRISEDLYHELIETGRLNTRKEWNDMQLDFLEKHRYFTTSNRSRRDDGKQKNLRQLNAAVKTLG